MRFFNKKEEKSEIKEEEYELKELENIITNKIKEESDEVLRKARDIIEDIKSVINPINAIGEEINTIKLSKHELATQYISAMNNAKRNLLSVIKSINKNIPEINDINDLDNAKKQISSILSKLGEVAGSHRRIIYELFPSQAKKLKAELEKLQEYSDELNRLLDNYKERITILEGSKAKIAEIIKADKELVKIKEDKDSIEKSIKALDEKEASLAKELSEAEKDQGYIKYKELLDNIKKEYNKLLSDLSRSLSSISRAINKYDYTLGIDKTRKQLLTSIIKRPSNIANIDAKLLSSLFDDIIKAIRDSKIQLKSPEKDISNLEELRDRLAMYVSNAREYEIKIKEIEQKMKPLHANITRLKDDLARVRNDINQLKSKSIEYTNRIKELEDLIENNINKIRDELEKLMLKVKIKH
ncbi:MAG: hypothetical protein KatS3mg003_1335 [Candidatus Nitrosocaldaceae archaeon]|nr:MAG: hypothetical protein KatS3mg003_1335 [Candidatus Nitrosocaldaceae archaeon]